MVSTLPNLGTQMVSTLPNLGTQMVSMLPNFVFQMVSTVQNYKLIFFLNFGHDLEALTSFGRQVLDC